MFEINKNRASSPIVRAALALDHYFSELERLGGQINSLDMKTEFDFEQAQRLMSRFAECGEGLSAEVINLSTCLGESRVRAEGIALGVSERAQQLKAYKDLQGRKFDEFRLLGEKVRALTEEMNQLNRSEGENLSDADRAQLAASLAAFSEQLNPLIEQAQNLRKEARESKMRVLEQNADSLTQTLQAVRQKLDTLQPLRRVPGA
jgi:hypothetical protein